MRWAHPNHGMGDPCHGRVATHAMVGPGRGCERVAAAGVCALRLAERPGESSRLAAIGSSRSTFDEITVRPAHPGGLGSQALCYRLQQDTGKNPAQKSRRF